MSVRHLKCIRCFILSSRLLLFSGKHSTDDVKLSELSLKPGMKIMMMGSREEELSGVIEPPSTAADVVNDFDIEDDEIAIQDRLH